MSRSKRKVKSTAGIRLDKNGKPYYAARNEKGHFVKRSYNGRVYYPENGKLAKAGIGVARAKNTTGRGSQVAPKKEKVHTTRPISKTEKRDIEKRGIEYDEHGNIIMFHGENPQSIIGDPFPTPVLHEPISGNPTKTFLYDNTDMGRWKRNKDKYTNVDNKKSSDDEFVFDYAAQARWGLDEKKQRYMYELFKEANGVVDTIKRLTDDELHEDKIAARFSYNLNIKPEVLGRRIDAALELTEKGAYQYLRDVAKQYRQDFIDSFTEQFEEEDIKEFLEELSKLNDRQFLSIIKFANKSNLAYAVQSIMDEFNYEEALGEVGRLTRLFKDYHTNPVFRNDVKWKNYKKE